MKWINQRWVGAMLLFLSVWVSGCATHTPVGVSSLGRNAAYDQIDQSALSSPTYSSATANILHRYNLESTYKKDPVRCLLMIHQHACTDKRRDSLFALAELSYLIGKRGVGYTIDGRVLPAENFFTASAVYAYLFLLGPGVEEAPDSFDRRFRLACDFYNRSLGFVIASREGQDSDATKVWQLPVGAITIARSPKSDFTLPLKENETYVSADRFEVRGLSVRNRIAGMGSPIVIVGEKKGGAIKTSSSSATVFLRVEGGVEDLQKNALQSTVEIYSAFSRSTVEVNGRSIPLELDLTAQIAYALNNPAYWKIEKMLFRLGQSPFDPGVYMSQPYQRGKIPVLLVHGTMSSPVWWAEMWNTLMGDPTVREKFQFWFYLYDSAKPVAQSAAHLRASIVDKVEALDAEGTDDLLREMVVIGHSQGGLLTKLTATQTGETLVTATTGKSIAELQLSPEEEDLIRRVAVFDPLEEVSRVVFISTPHRGSYRAGGLMQKLARRFLELPKKALETTTQMLSISSKLGKDVQMASTSIDTMAPDNPAMLALAELPVDPSIKAHSIIAVKGHARPPEGADGVVKYTSAHIAGVESELVVKSGHSCQGKPQTIEEVRRILLQHLDEIPSGTP